MVQQYKEVDVNATFELMELLLKYGQNYLSVDYYHAFMCASH